MKKKDTNLLLFTLFLAAFVISIPSIFNRESQEVNNFGINLENSQVSWNVSDYDQFVGPALNTTSELKKFRIFIDDDDPEFNWTKTEGDFGWCTGSGIEGDPYIIQDLYIDVEKNGGGIYIRDSDKYFVIRNCWINNSGVSEFDAAVFLRYTSNGVIEENIFTYMLKGVMVEFSSSDISISGNYMISDPVVQFGRAISVSGGSSDINITRNMIYNFYSPMYINSQITNITIQNNYLTNTVFKEWEDAPVRFRLVNTSKVIYNTLDGVYAQTGVFVDVIGGVNNTVFNNTIVSGGVDVPDVPILSGSLKISAPDTSAVNLEDCNYNLVAHNRILSSSDADIPGYDTLLILGLFGVIFIALAIRINLKKKQA